MPTRFTVSGPFRVPVYQAHAAKTITKRNIKDFWLHHEDAGEQRGCYVFAINAGRGLTPGYVGRATRTFKQEVFSGDKVAKYQQFLAGYRRGAPVLFFIVAPRQTGKPNQQHIKELERFLIRVAMAANPDLVNIKGIRREQWSIAGMLRSGQGKRSNAAIALLKALKL